MTLYNSNMASHKIIWYIQFNPIHLLQVQKKVTPHTLGHPHRNSTACPICPFTENSQVRANLSSTQDIPKNLKVFSHRLCCGTIVAPVHQPSARGIPSGLLHRSAASMVSDAAFLRTAVGIEAFRAGESFPLPTINIHQSSKSTGVNLVKPSTCRGFRGSVLLELLGGQGPRIRISMEYNKHLNTSSVVIKWSRHSWLWVPKTSKNP